jgi:hypothetical protein
VRLHRPAHQERAAQVHADHGVPVRVGHPEQQVVANHARVVDQYRRRSEPFGHLRDGRRDLVAVRDVGPDRHGPAARVDDGPRALRTPGFVQIDQGHRQAVVRQAPRGRRADAARRAGHHGHSIKLR